MVLNLRILIVGIKAVIGAILAVRIKDSAKGKKSVNRIKVIFRLGLFLKISKKAVQFKHIINVLKIEVSDVG